MRRIKYIFIGIVLLLLFPLSSMSQYFVVNFEIWENASDNTQVNERVDSYKIVFNADSSLGISEKVMYVKRNETISLIDAPKYTCSDGYLERNSSAGSLSILEGFNKTISVVQDLNFSATEKTDANSSSPESLLVFDSSINSNYNGGFSYDNNLSNKRRTVTVSESKTDGTISNFGEFNNNISILKDIQLNLNVNINGSQKLESNWDTDKTYSDAINGDNYIGLEDNANYCANRINLSNDILLINSMISIGARNGCRGSNAAYFQLNYQNMIVGQYSEIDLCGHYLIIGSNSEIRAVGSIVNSDPSRGGLIVESGGNLETTFTVEDHHHEKSLPMSYLHGDSAFSMYRSPYFNVKTMFFPGCNYQLGLHMFFGPTQGNIYKELNLIGGTNPIFDLTDGYIVRNVDYDDEIRSATTSFESYNLMYQKIRYSFYNCNFDINLPSFDVDFGMSATIVLGKENFYIPPYLSFYLYNSNITIYDTFVFYPGSYLYIDDSSSIYFSYKNVDENTHSGGIWNPLNTIYGVDYGFQKSAGLQFLCKVEDYKEAIKRIDDGDSANGSSDGDNALIFSSAFSFWNYLSENRPALLDLHGSIIFNKSTNNLYQNYTLGGNVNIYNLDNFYNVVSGLTKISFYISNFKFASCKFSGLVISNQRTNILQFSFAPLISFGNVLTNPENPSTLIEKNKVGSIKFSSDDGIIEDSLNNNKYAFIFDNEEMDNLNRSGYSKDDFANGYDDLNGQIKQITYNDEHKSIISSTGERVYFHGMFVKASNITGSFSSNNLTATLNLTKFRHENCKYGGSISSRNAKFDKTSQYSCWRLS